MTMSTKIPFILSASMLVLSVACDSEHQVGDELGEQGTSTGGLEIENLVASIADEYQCPAGFIGGYDDVTSCNCDTSSYCDASPALGGICVCDALCHASRPMIDCADYAITFRLANAAGQRIDRMTRIGVRVGELELREGGLDCYGFMWSVGDGDSSSITEIRVAYDQQGNSRYAIPGWKYPCTSGADGPSVTGESGSSWPEPDLGDPLPPAVGLGGDAIITIEGLFEDGSPWVLEATAQLQ